MIRSMTAFGRAKEERGGRDITVEIKSVNNRYFDCSVKVPHLFSYFEEKIRSYVSSRQISRGKIDVFVKIDVTEQTGVEIKLDEAYAESYIAALKTLRDKFGLADDISTMRVAQNRDIFSVKSADEDAEREWENFLPVLTAAVDAFVAAREREGANMRADIEAKKARVMELADKIGPLSEADKAASYERIKARVKQLAGEVPLDEGRIITECGLYADKLAVDEELVRLASHFAEFDRILDANEPAGRKLDFLLQEINRETNTIGSKASNAEIAKYVVEMKSELEKIREQVQNIE